MNIRGATALVTGGAGGIGLAVARRLLEGRARVVLWDNDREALGRAAGELSALGPVRSATVDVTDAAAVQSEAARLAAEGWDVDLLDANAGVAFPGDLLEMEQRRLEATFRVNVEGVANCIRAFAPPMVRKGRGHVVLMASAAALTAVPGLAAYAASKHAVIGLADSFRLELRRRGALGVKVTVVCPGFVRTPLFAGVEAPVVLPWLTPQGLAALIADGVERDLLYVRAPWIVRWLPLLRSVSPTFLHDRLGDWLGLTHSTDPWKGRAG